MLPADLLGALKAYTLTQRQLPGATPDTVNGTPGNTPKENFARFELGQKIQGTVLAETAPGLFKVNVANQLMQMPLPAAIRPGDSVALQVVSLQPRLVFSMAASANPLSTQEQLSSAARIISALAQQQPGQTVLQAKQSTPLWASNNPPQPAPLASLLRESMGNSGLFYEAHQAQWLEGARSTAQLLQEPQNRAAMPLASEQASATTTTHLQASLHSDGATAQANRLATATEQLQLPDHLKPLVQQQLNALETNQVVWQGYVWPGQTMRWTIQDQEARADTLEEERQWVTQLQLELPKLGKISATVRLTPAGVSLALETASPEARALLGSASTQLVAALDDAGIPVTGTQVTQHEP